MPQPTPIEWTDLSSNPFRARDKATGKTGWFCTHASEGCRFCYSEVLNKRFGTKHAYTKANEDMVEIYLHEKELEGILKLKPGTEGKGPHGSWLIFVGDMTDIFHPMVSDAVLDELFAVMALRPQHTFQLLTKRPERMLEYFQRIEADDSPVLESMQQREMAPWYRLRCSTIDVDYDEDGGLDCVHLMWPLPNVWCGVSVEDQPNADRRREAFAELDAAIKYVSYEPALGPVNWHGWEFVNQIIGGGESGPNARPSHPDWFRATRDWCHGNEVAYFHKQWGEWLPISQMGDSGSDHLYLPAPKHDPERVRKCKVDNVVIQWDGSIRDEWPKGAMLTFKVGKKAAGRLLDGKEHSDIPEVSYATN